MILPSRISRDIPLAAVLFRRVQLVTRVPLAWAWPAVRHPRVFCLLSLRRVTRLLSLASSCGRLHGVYNHQAQGFCTLENRSARSRPSAGRRSCTCCVFLTCVIVSRVQAGRVQVPVAIDTVAPPCVWGGFRALRAGVHSRAAMPSRAALRAAMPSRAAAVPSCTAARALPHHRRALACRRPCPPAPPPCPQRTFLLLCQVQFSNAILDCDWPYVCFL
jgi:hypothetical protein